MKKIDDPIVARSLLEKVNSLNIDTAIKCLLVSGTFAALPQSVSAPLVVVAVAFAGKNLFCLIVCPVLSFTQSDTFLMLIRYTSSPCASMMGVGLYALNGKLPPP